MSPGQALKMTSVSIQRENVDSEKEDDAKRHSEEGSLCTKERTVGKILPHITQKKLSLSNHLLLKSLISDFLSAELTDNKFQARGKRQEVSLS